MSRNQRARSAAPSYVRCPWGTRIQSLLFDKRIFDPDEAYAWCREHRMRTDGFDQSANYWRARQAEPSSFFAGNLRTIQLGRGQSRVRAIVGCPLTRPRSARRRR